MKIYRKIISTQYARRWAELPEQLQITLECGHNQWVRDPESLARAISMPFRKKALCRECMKSAQHRLYSDAATAAIEPAQGKTRRAGKVNHWADCPEEK